MKKLLTIFLKTLKEFFYYLVIDYINKKGVDIMANYAITDLHGMWDLWEQVKNYCKSDDVIYFLGDAADRGDDGIKIIKDLLLDKRVI
jgi:hypothetical protein